MLLKKLRDALEALRGRVAGKSKDDVKDAISIVSYSPPQLSDIINIRPPTPYPPQQKY